MHSMHIPRVVAFILYLIDDFPRHQCDESKINLHYENSGMAIYLEATAWTMNQLDRNFSENKNNSTSHAAMSFPHGVECPLLCQVCTQFTVLKIREKIVVAKYFITVGISTLSLSSLNSSSNSDETKRKLWSSEALVSNELHELELRRNLVIRSKERQL
ncbi:uncharacterized protein LOC134220827 isoform X2 [Armigeres subalbatus]|uniref:uncharacterized protein LOC134220827 isoform X2 n=1 Tax=Armigeres subalbatus TaxID=124917 RepID=UPI002ED2CAF7